MLTSSNEVYVVDDEGYIVEEPVWKILLLMLACLFFVLFPFSLAGWFIESKYMPALSAWLKGILG